MAVASLVLGIISIICSFWGLGGYIAGLIVAVVGLILGIVAKKKAPSKMATAGLALSIIGIVLTTIFLVACVACVQMATKSGVDSALKSLESMDTKSGVDSVLKSLESYDFNSVE